MTETRGIAEWGPLVLTTDVDDWLLATLEEWLPTYLDHAKQERGLGFTLPRPRTYVSVFGDDEALDHQIPAVIVNTSKTLKTLGGQNFIYQATWKVTVAALVRGRDARSTKHLAALYEGCIRRALSEKSRSPEGPVNDIKWMESELIPVHGQPDDGRYLAAGCGTYNVFTDQALQGFGGPNIPNAETYLSEAEVTEVEVHVEAED